MIVLDTNVVSETMRERPEPGVVAFLDRLERSEVLLTSITLAEIRSGLARLPAGRRRIRLHEAAERLLDGLTGRGPLVFDDAAASHYATIAAARESAGRSIPAFDAMIAAMCRVAGATLATRNVADFDGTGIEVVNPWEVAV